MKYHRPGRSDYAPHEPRGNTGMYLGALVIAAQYAAATACMYGLMRLALHTW